MSEIRFPRLNKKHLGFAGALILVAAWGAPVTAGPTEGGVEIGLSIGHDSNPLELNENGSSGAYSQVDLEGDLEQELSPRTEYFLTGYGSHRAHESGLSDANASWANIETGLSLTPWRQGPKRFSVAFGGSFALSRSTYVDPTTGQVYLVGGNTVSLNSIPDRFDYDKPGAFVDLRWRPSRRIQLSLDTMLEQRSFIEDYTNQGLDDLDDETISIRPAIRVLASDTVILALSWEKIDRTYDSLPALDEDGFEIPGRRREYRYSISRLGMDFEPSSDTRMTLGYRQAERDDVFAGYYDSSTTDVYATARFDVTALDRIRFRGMRRDQEYDRATVTGDPSSQFLGSEVTRLSGQYERALGKRMSFLFEAGWLDSEDNDAFYVYDRNWTQAGVRFKL